MSEPSGTLLSMFDTLIDLVLPRCCLGCGRSGTPLCLRCVPAARTQLLAAGTLDVVAVGTYADVLRQALIGYKERGRRDLARALGMLLAHSVQASLDRFAVPARGVVLVPVPSARAASAARGGDHLLRLARRAAVVSGARVAPDVLRPTRTVLDSAGLGAQAREVNLHQAYRARAPNGRVALVVDDIVTTGATLREAQRALTEAGWPVCGAAVVAATPRRAKPDPIGSTHVTGLAWE